jgi:16S rRNA (adenine1518-N6/adenine1519-N6)-dimethyltransferase
MIPVRAKKYLGQHFLTDKNIAGKIVNALEPAGSYTQVLEVGPGMGVLTGFLLQKTAYETFLIDLDAESVQYLKDNYPQTGDRLIHGDFLELDIASLFPGKLAVIGNFPYNISSQILFKILGHRQQVVEVVGMFQKEVAERCVAGPGKKDYGILSVLLQAYYTIEYLFTVKAGAFNPPPKVLSGVIRLKRNDQEHLGCDETLFKQVVKAGFNQRRKTLGNALSGIIRKGLLAEESLLGKRAEQLSITDFIRLTNRISEEKNGKSATSL